MIVDEGQDKNGKHFKLGLIDRLALTLENYASSKFGSRFYDEPFLQGLCQRRDEIHASTTRSASGLVVSTTILAFFDKLEGTTSIMGLTFSIPELGSFSLCVLVAANFLALTLSMLDQIVLERFIYTLGARIGIHQFELFLLNFSAKNLWTIALTPKYSGLKSGPSHKIVYFSIMIFYLFFILIFSSFPVLVVGATIVGPPTAELSIAARGLGTISLLIFAFSFYLIFVFLFRYNFRSSGLPEPTVPFQPENSLEMGSPLTEVREEKP